MINLLEDDVDRGLLMAPNLRVIDVNLIGCIYTTKLGLGQKVGIEKQALG